MGCTAPYQLAPQAALVVVLIKYQVCHTEGALEFQQVSIKSVYKKFFNKDLINYPLFTFKDQLHYSKLLS